MSAPSWTVRVLDIEPRIGRSWLPVVHIKQIGTQRLFLTPRFDYQNPEKIYKETCTTQKEFSGAKGVKWTLF